MFSNAHERLALYPRERDSYLQIERYRGAHSINVARCLDFGEVPRPDECQNSLNEEVKGQQNHALVQSRMQTRV